eukprot:TRINITY_DN1246_c0_g1_i3.p1 TRINITY_DN1246_c0_g1~~TRINITY_DN1246_c0_g1_i3.p1  ORF type:complete len:405 (+),score=36.79 TRINITY_DN1246_c0_g1_i3:101-1315(+)
MADRLGEVFFHQLHSSVRHEVAEQSASTWKRVASKFGFEASTIKNSASSLEQTVDDFSLNLFDRVAKGNVLCVEVEAVLRSCGVDKAATTVHKAAQDLTTATRAPLLPVQADQLEVLLADGGKLTPVKKLLEVIGCVVRVTRGDHAKGSGTLVELGGFVWLLTNRHILGSKQEIAGAYFELGVIDDTKTPTKVELSASDVAVIGEGDLDFALCRVPRAAVQSHPRLQLPLQELGLLADSPVIVFQHPGGGPMKVSVGRLKAATDETFTYSAQTLGGSSGSPVLNKDFELIGIHYGGVDGEHNCGVKLSSILNFVNGTNVLAGLSSAPPTLELLPQIPGGAAKATSTPSDKPGDKRLVTNLPTRDLGRLTTFLAPHWRKIGPAVDIPVTDVIVTTPGEQRASLLM